MRTETEELHAIWDEIRPPPKPRPEIPEFRLTPKVAPRDLRIAIDLETGVSASEVFATVQASIRTALERQVGMPFDDFAGLAASALEGLRTAERHAAALSPQSAAYSGDGEW